MYVKGLNMCEMVTHKAADAKQPTQVMDVGVEGSAPDMSVRVLSHIVLLGFIESNDRPRQIWRHQILVWHSPDNRYLDTLGC